MPYLHLPVQSGSDRILAAMNRKHTGDAYRRLIDAHPGGAARHRALVGLHRRLPGRDGCGFRRHDAAGGGVGFASAFSFKYSPRPGTPAAERADRCRRRSRPSGWRGCRSCWKRSARPSTARPSAATLDVLFEKPGRHPGQMAGKSPYLQAGADRQPSAGIGEIVPVRIVRAGGEQPVRRGGRSAAATACGGVERERHLRPADSVTARDAARAGLLRTSIPASSRRRRDHPHLRRQPPRQPRLRPIRPEPRPSRAPPQRRRRRQRQPRHRQGHAREPPSRPGGCSKGSTTAPASGRALSPRRRRRRHPGEHAAGHRCFRPRRRRPAGLTAFDQIATRKRGPVRARNAAQNAYIKALKQHELVFAEGPGRHRQDLARRRPRGVAPRAGPGRAADPVAPGGGGRRTARLSARRHAREGRSLSAPDLRRPLRFHGGAARRARACRPA